MPGAEPSRGQWGRGQWLEGFPTSGHAENTERVVSEGRGRSAAAAARGARQQVNDAISQLSIPFLTPQKFVLNTLFKYLS